VQLPFVYHRQKLASSLVDGMAGVGIIDFSSGMFLTAPRRTGKSTFLKEDLIPACLSAGWEPVYVDLWSNRDADPSTLIESAIVSKLSDHESQVTKLLKSTGVSQVTVLRSVTWDLSTGKLPAGATLSDALQLLSAATGRLVVLIVDEAQHALNSNEGVNAMFALKAARDALNQGGKRPGLRLVFTGSSRDKLAQLVLHTKQPFFGAEITPFPLLDRDFVEAYTKDLNAKLAETNHFDKEDMYQAFCLVGHRPELLASIVRRVALEMGEAPNLGDLLERNAHEFQEELWIDYRLTFEALPALQKAVLQAMAEQSTAKLPFAPFKEDTLSIINGHLCQLDPKAKAPTATKIQKALESLREKEIVWRSGRGAYALEDGGMAEWLNRP
jgi:hypothetical protein